jgi:hypothetical protein
MEDQVGAALCRASPRKHARLRFFAKKVLLQRVREPMRLPADQISFDEYVS